MATLKVSKCRIFCVFGGMINVEFNFVIQTFLHTIVYLYLQQVYNFSFILLHENSFMITASE
jgi:hypothetical protein